MNNNSSIIVRNIKIKASSSADGEAVEEARRRLTAAGIACGAFAAVNKKSVDARRRELFFVYSVTAGCDAPPSEEALKRAGAELLDESGIDGLIKPGGEPLAARPIVAGFGPCGMFAALVLAENGYAPLVLERGEDVDARAASCERFRSTGALDTESNIQFGAGGAGTFSDGKLVTRINDGKCRYVLERLCEFGAPGEILYTARPHIGTDRLRGVVAELRDRVISLGGELRFNTKLEDIKFSNGRVLSVTVSGREGGSETLPCGALVLAPGHSARDTYKMLQERGFALSPKPFSAGVRIEHLQEDIDRALYGDFAGAPYLGRAEYNLSHREGERGVYTFCMCPGGEVVAAASEENGVVVNGMSPYMRDGKNANSAVAVSVLRSDYGGTVDGAIAFQRRLEQAAFRAAGGDYSAPVQTMSDFLEGKSGGEPSRITPSYRGGAFVRPCALDRLLPDFVTSMLRTGFRVFNRRIEGFACPDAVLTGVETRTSAPIRIERDDSGRAVGFENVYPGGEGAGYAGGITSAAVDGIGCALHLMERSLPARSGL